MSILMTGSVGLPEGEGGCNLDQNGRIWTGKWRFVKEKKEHDFHYRWTSDEIPLDLIQYVSFAISEPNLQLVRGRSKKKKKRKGRLPGTKLKPPKKTEQQVDKLDSEILAIDMGGVETPFRGELSVPWGMEGAAEDPFASIKSHTDSTDVTGQQDLRSELNLPEAGQSPVDQQDALKGAEEESEGGSEDGESGEEDEGESFAPRGIEKEGDAMISETTGDDTSFTVKLDTARSPLFGLWTGFFNVDPPPESATPVPVHETFFLYAFAGTPLESLPPALSSLPPEQSHSLQLLPNPRSKESARAISAPPLSPTFHCSQYAVATTANSSLHTNGSNGLHQPQAKAAEDLKEVTSCPSESTPCIPVNDGPAATSTPALSSVEVAPPAEVSLPKDATPLAVAPSSSSDHDVILGFGRNVYGRYSLMCHFDIANQSLRCEKRYMLTKQGNARRPKLKDIIGQNPSQHSSICNGDSGTHSLKRKRIPKSKFFAGILDEELMFSNGAGEDGRSYSQGPEETKRVSVGSGVGRPPTKHQTLLQQQYLPHTAFSNGDHKHFRDAFFDVLSGEIYEGGNYDLIN